MRSRHLRRIAIGSYFRAGMAAAVASLRFPVLIYNVGLLATPWFEGRLAQCLADILGGNATCCQDGRAGDRLYVLVTLIVQAARFVKRFYVRRFANNINRRMKGILYANLVRQSRAALEKEGVGRADDQGHFRRGRLRGGHAEIHHRRSSIPAWRWSAMW